MSFSQEASGGNDGTAPGPRATGTWDDEFDVKVANGVKADVRMFSGCKDIQQSADVHDVTKFGVPDAVGGAGGACTNALLLNVKDHKPDSWMSLLKGMRATLKAKNFKQIPQLATSKKMDINSPFSLAGGAGGDHKALLIGINYAGSGAAELKGCHNDAQQMGEYIVEHGYPEAGPSLKLLMDDGKHEPPTKANILKAIKWLVEGAKAGDSLFMHFSGHGGSIMDSSGDEEDNMDETMIPMDFNVSGQIKDDELFAELVSPLPEGVVLSVMMDCCHSGSILDLPYYFDANDDALRLVDAGGNGAMLKKANFNLNKVRKAGKDPHHASSYAAAGASAFTAATESRLPSGNQDQGIAANDQPAGQSPVRKAGKDPHYASSYAAAGARASTAATESRLPSGNQDQGIAANDQPAGQSPPTPTFKLSIETQVLKCMETGGYVAPDPCAFRSFASCEGDMEKDGKDDCDLSMFVVHADITDMESGFYHAGGISMVWVDSESSTGYSMKHITEGDARFAGKRAMYIEAAKGEGQDAFLVAVFAPEDFDPKVKRASPKSTTFMVWVCHQITHSKLEKATWTACGSFTGTKVKKTSATTSPSGEHLIVIEALDSNNEDRVFYGTSLGNEDLQMSTFPKPRAMASLDQQMFSVQASTLEKDGRAFAIAMTLPKPSGGEEEEVVSGPSTLFAQSLNDPSLYAGSIDIPGDTRCFITAPADGLKSDVYLAGTKKLIWYDDEPWHDATHDKRGDKEVRGVQLNKVDFAAPAIELRTVIDNQYSRHVFVLLENGKLLYTSQAPGNDNKFEEPVDILPSVAAFSCHVDSIGNIHVNNINQDGNLMHHMMDHGTGMWMQKEVMVPGGAAMEHIISVVDLKVTAITQAKGGGKGTGTSVRDFVQAAQVPLPAMSFSCAAAAIVRINGKGHLMHTDKTVEVVPNASGSVRIGQFVDSFSVPRVRVNMEGLDRPLEIMCGKVLHQKLEKMDASALKDAKFRDQDGQERGSLITDPDDQNNTESFMDSVHKLIQGFQVLSPTDFAKTNDIDGIFRLAGRALTEENQFVAFAEENVSHNTEEQTNRGVIEEKRADTGLGRPKIGSSVTKRFTKLHPTPQPFGMGHHGIARGRQRVECRSMGNIVKKAKENADEAIFKAKQQAASACRVKVANAKRAQDRADRYAQDATKWASQARQAIEAVKWMQESVDATQAVVTAFENEKTSLPIRAIHTNDTLDVETLDALKAASDAMQVAAIAEDKSYQARILREEAGELADAIMEVDDDDGDDDGDDSDDDGDHGDDAGGGDIDEYGSTEYSNRGFKFKRVTKSVKKAAKKTTSNVKNAAKTAQKAAEDTARKAQKELEKANKIAEEKARNAREVAMAAKRQAEKVADQAQRKAEAAAKAAKREAEKAARLVEEAAREAEKAAELAEGELKDKAEKAAAGAKKAAEEAAKLAEEATNAVKDGVENAADEIHHGVVIAIEEVEDITVDIKDEVEDTVLEIADVVEDVTITVVDVVEEVVEEVWENTKEGLVLVSRKVVEVTKKAVDFVVKVGNAVYHFVETAYEQLVKGLDWLWTQIKTGVKAALDFLAELFGLAEILKTADLLQDSVVAGLDTLLASIPTEEQVRGFFNEIRLTLEDATGLDLDGQEFGDQEPDSERDVDPRENFVSHHAGNGTFNQSVVEEADGPGDDGESEGGLGKKLQRAFSIFQETGSLNSVLFVLLDGILDMLEGTAVTAMDALGYVGEKFRDWIAGGGVVYVPILSEMYKLATGNKLKMGKLVFFMLAIPFTYTCKALFGKWPSQMLSRELLSGLKTGGSSGARSAFSSRDAPAVSMTSPPEYRSRDTTTSGSDDTTSSSARNKGGTALVCVGIICSSIGTMVQASEPEEGPQYPPLMAPSTFKVIATLLAFTGNAIKKAPDQETTFFAALRVLGPLLGTMGRLDKKYMGLKFPNLKFWVVGIKIVSRLATIVRGILTMSEGGVEIIYGLQTVFAGATGLLVSVDEYYKAAKIPMNYTFKVVAFSSNFVAIMIGLPLALTRVNDATSLGD